jgi:hypothetical protein
MVITCLSAAIAQRNLQGTTNETVGVVEQSSLERKYMPKATRLAVLHFTLVAWQPPISFKASVRRPIQKMPLGS